MGEEEQKRKLGVLRGKALRSIHSTSFLPPPGSHSMLEGKFFTVWQSGIVFLLLLERPQEVFFSSAEEEIYTLRKLRPGELSCAAAYSTSTSSLVVSW